ncbi:MAG: hypothetical protein NTV29_13145 [Planctomycetota bacterium]|nr:hypothetical protein [Planctomycetota bacterium]
MEMRQTRFGKTFWIGLCSGVALCAMLATSYWLGRLSSNSAPEQQLVSSKSIPGNRVHPDLPVEWLKATATHGSANIAVCTAAAGEEAEGFFALDFLTGDLKGWVYYPRMQAFGGLFATNVIQYLGTAGGKNPEYLLVSGASASGPTGGQVRASQSLIYVVDVKLGTFVAFAIPWSRAMESSGVAQMNTLLPIGGDAIRPMTNAGAQRKAPALDPNQKANQANPNANPNQANPDANPNANPNQANPNQVPNNQNRKQP